MKAEDLMYQNLKTIIAPFEEKERGESVAFLNWFLENIYRLDSVDADDAICDRPNDKGIDGIFVDHTQEEILVLQGKLKQRESTIGDSPLRELAGTMTQLADEKSVQALLDGGANEELKRLIVRNNIKVLISKGYKVIGVFVCNQSLDENGREFLRQDLSLRAYDRERIASEYIDIDVEGGISGKFTFDASYVSPMIIRTSDRATTYILPIQALELVKMAGIEDGTLFSQNVRQSLGNTKVNKALRDSVLSQSEHENFPLYHNGVNILCEKALLENEKLIINNYVVVNGAQSISTFKKSADKLSENLRVIAKIIQIKDQHLSRKITINSNNQNAIKPRDLKSTNEVQVRLREEFLRIENGKYELEIKRGQEQKEGSILITNEEAGRLLLAFDLMEPESCHQVYKLFDDKYADIFARPAVTAYRIIVLYLIMERIQKVAANIAYKPLSRYGLTRFFLMSVVAELVKSDEKASEYLKNPKMLFDTRKIDKFVEAIETILQSIIVDLNYEIEDLGDQFDYKGDLKSPKKIQELRNKLLRSYEKDVARNKADSLANLIS
ncbi:AIPR protein [Nitrosomonas nitrosa]|uniref:AIPR protein n=1 Tax=Nitrosomonas nitrosa TaxID=52442 RepID=A0A1I4M778_9PROT|nr:AIPR family protein [Nitrosomonas nitrosa]SFL98905.1 AIPR protein [Nitrosomonas nitrosa]